MKYPLTFWQRLGREISCTFLTHKWKLSWRRRDDYNERYIMNYDKLSYRDRESGNAYYEYSSGWVAKCRRCRKRVRNSHVIELRKQLYYGIRAVVSELQFAIRSGTDELFTGWPLYAKVSWSIVEAFAAFVVHQEWIYTSIYDLLIDASFKFRDWLYVRYEPRNTEQ